MSESRYGPQSDAVHALLAEIAALDDGEIVRLVRAQKAHAATIGLTTPAQAVRRAHGDDRVRRGQADNAAHDAVRALRDGHAPILARSAVEGIAVATALRDRLGLADWALVAGGWLSFREQAEVVRR